MHLQQTKARSRATGGPQYYFHDVVPHVKEYLRGRGACPVVLQTPYGIAATSFVAVGKDHKIDADGEPSPGKVGHDRIQGGIGEAIREWHGIRDDGDFERIDVEVSIHPEGHFILIPTMVYMRQRKRPIVLEKIHAPLSFNHDYQSKLWRKKIEAMRSESESDVDWAAGQISRVVESYRDGVTKNILEADLLRTSGALSLLGMELGPYLGKGYDCAESCFQFGRYPVYPCPVEIKKRSSGFNYQITRYSKLPRATLLCVIHDKPDIPDQIDVIELPVLASYLNSGVK